VVVKWSSAATNLGTHEDPGSPPLLLLPCSPPLPEPLPDPLLRPLPLQTPLLPLPPLPLPPPGLEDLAEPLFVSEAAVERPEEFEAVTACPATEEDEQLARDSVKGERVPEEGRLGRRGAPAPSAELPAFGGNASSRSCSRRCCRRRSWITLSYLLSLEARRWPSCSRESKLRMSKKLCPRSSWSSYCNVFCTAVDT